MSELPEKSSTAPSRRPRRASPPSMPPLPRFSGARAEEATLRAELEAARRKSDLDAERKIGTALARLLARRDRRRDEAATLALRAIRIRDDAELRRDVAEWLESLGEPALAAAVLAPLAHGAEASVAVPLLARVATLYARAGDAEGALDVLDEVSELDPQAALPLELKGTMSGWAMQAISAREAAEAFAAAAERRAASDADPFEDLLRAFEADPSSPVAAGALADALAGRGKRLAADEIRREHARALRSIDRDASAEVHRKRREEAIAQGAVARALGAILDEALVRGSLGEEPELAELFARAGVKDAFVDRAAALDPSRLDAIAESAPPNVRPVLLSFAADLLLERGDSERARMLAQRACDIEQNYPRSAATLAAAVIGDRDGLAATALERAIRLVCARGALCAALSKTHEALGAFDVAVAWAQHTVALRPGDGEALERWFRCSIVARDAARLGDAISWAVAQPQPASSLAGLVSEGLQKLVELDVDRAAVLARRALDAFGPHRRELREAVELVADRARDDALAAALLERFASAGAKADERPGLLMRLAALRSRLGDVDGEVIALARAVREGLDPKELKTAPASLRERTRTSDGVLAALELEARVAQATGASNAVEAFRSWGVALADLAGDLRAAAAAWLSAAKLDKTYGPRLVARDLRALATDDAALTALLSILETENDPTTIGLLAEEASRLALSASQPGRAFALAKMALEKLPGRAEALEIAELGAAMEGRPADLSPLYETVARRAHGRFGRRASHFRAARYFERQELFFLALRHAGEAFAAVPSESALGLLARIGERSGDRAAVVRAVVNVAEASRSKEVRSAWLLRAADLASDDEDGARQRVDILLRGAVASPDRTTLERLGIAIHRLLSLAPYERDAISLRVGNAARMLTARVEGPDGARIAIEITKLAIGAFGDAEGAAYALERALGADADVDEYAVLMPHVDALARAAAKIVPAGVATATKPYANVGEAALRLLGAIAEKAGNAEAQATFAELLAKKVEPKPEESLDLADEDVVEAKSEPAFAAAASVLPVDAAGFPSEEVPIPLSRRVDHGTVKIPDLEQQALMQARNASFPPAARAERLDAVAAAREARGDLEAAAEALLEAAHLEPQSVERWRALFTVAETAHQKDHVITALGQLEQLVEGGERTRVLRQLARALQEAGRGEEALAAWRRLLELLPDDEEADQAVEIMVSEARDYERLAEHLAGRVLRLGRHPDRRDSIRAAKLRRAAILEQRLDRPDEACAELEALLEEAPQNESALRYLADLYERRGEFERAAALLRRLADLARGPQTRNDLGLRAAFALRDAGDLRSALGLVKTLLEREPDLDAMALHVELARALDDDVELGNALERAAASGRHDDTVAAEMWVEAAQAAAHASNPALALARARKGAEANPTSAEAQLFARALEYRERGPGDEDAARATLAELGKLEGDLSAEDVALWAFLRAEALVALDRAREAKIALTEALARVGPHTLLSLGLAERLAESGNPIEALPMFEAALAGDLYGFRTRGRVALKAGQVAASAQRIEEALAFYDVAAAEEWTRDEALERMLPLASTLGDKARSRDLLVALARRAPNEDRARRLAEVARVLLSSPDQTDIDDGQRILAEAVSASLEGSAERASLERALEQARRRSSRPPEVAPASVPPASAPVPVPVPASDESASTSTTTSTTTSTATSSTPAPVGLEDMIEPPSRRSSSIPPAVRIAELEEKVRSAANPEERERACLALAQMHVDRGAMTAAEMVLQEALASGSIAAGDELAILLAHGESRTTDLVRVRSRLVDLAPGDATRLEDLRAAAAADQNLTYARAVEHVIRAFDPGAGPLPPPPLVVQREQPGVLTLVARGPWKAPVAEAFALVWEHAGAMFARDPAHYSLSGVEHLSPGPTSALSRLFEVSLRLLGTPTVHVYAKRSSEPPRASPLLLQQPSAMIVGDVREETVLLRYALGVAIGMAQPENLLMGGLEETDARGLYEAVVGAFGPSPQSSRLTAASGRYAGALWERLPPRAQRRMQDLLGGVKAMPSFEEIREATRQSARRVGLLLAGNVASVVRAVAVDRNLDIDALLSEGGLPAVARDPAIADLLRLAASSAYADARWRPLTPGPRTRPSGQFPVAS